MEEKNGILTKETIRNVSRQKLIQLYELLTTELPSITKEVFRNILETCMLVMGSNAIVSATQIDPGALMIRCKELTGEASNTAIVSLCKKIAEEDGFICSFTQTRINSSWDYALRIEHLPLELNWLETETKPIELKTVVRKLQNIQE